MVTVSFSFLLKLVAVSRN